MSREVFIAQGGEDADGEGGFAGLRGDLLALGPCAGEVVFEGAQAVAGEGLRWGVEFDVELGEFRDDVGIVGAGEEGVVVGSGEALGVNQPGLEFEAADGFAAGEVVIGEPVVEEVGFALELRGEAGEIGGLEVLGLDLNAHENRPSVP